MSTATVGGLLRKARQKAGMTLGQVAEILSVSIPYLSDVELNRRSISPERLRILADVLKMDGPAATKVFVKAGVLPPAVYARLLKMPQVWDKDFAQVLQSLDQIQEEMGERMSELYFGKLRKALKPVSW